MDNVQQAIQSTMEALRNNETFGCVSSLTRATLDNMRDMQSGDSGVMYTLATETVYNVFDILANNGTIESVSEAVDALDHDYGTWLAQPTVDQSIELIGLIYRYVNGEGVLDTLEGHIDTWLASLATAAYSACVSYLEDIEEEEEED